MQKQLRRGPTRRIAAAVLALGAGLVLVAVEFEAAWVAIPPVGALAIGFAARLRRKLRAATADREEKLRRERDLETRLRLVAARLEVATELHDAVAHRLVDINTRAGVAAHLGNSDPAQALEDVKRVSAQALADLRSTLSVMRQRDDPAPLIPTPTRHGDLA
jgi:signal transduction histidine kinase